VWNISSDDQLDFSNFEFSSFLLAVSYQLGEDTGPQLGGLWANGGHRIEEHVKSNPWPDSGIDGTSWRCIDGWVTVVRSRVRVKPVIVGYEVEVTELKLGQSVSHVVSWRFFEGICMV